MPRAKRGFKGRRRHKRVLKAASGFYGRRSTCFRRALDAVRHAMEHAYEGRKRKKRLMRRLWIVRLNAAARQHDLSYSRFIEGCGKAGIELDRKVLAEIAMHDQAAFGKVVEAVRAAL
ncbi:MAG: 50S ribosomal protein L20 [Nannocystis sp.]|jgi:large subunit ribosomal protein L20|nr:50S ribosomal protein L20 [Nannocystis sp.]